MRVSLGKGVISALTLALWASVATAFEGRYWSGKPQPIGIDFSYNGAVAVYADGPENFTRLAAMFPPPDSDYVQYQYKLFETWDNRWTEEKEICDDDDKLPSESWISQLPSILSAKYKTLRFESCLAALGRFRGGRYRGSCYGDDQITWLPVKPKSKYSALVSNAQRQGRIRDLMPKWFRTSPPARPLTKSNLVLSIVELLEALKKMALADHKVTFSSAVIARPQWADNEIGDLYEEACLLANIEAFEQPMSRVEAASLTAKPGGSVMALEHGRYHLIAHNFIWEEKEGHHRETESMHFRGLGITHIWQTLAQRIIQAHNQNVTHEESDWPSHVDACAFIQQVAIGRHYLKNWTGSPQGLGEQDHIFYVNITDATGKKRIINMTDDDVFFAEQKYVNAISENIDMSLEKVQELLYYQMSKDSDFPENVKDSDEYGAIMANIKQNVTPPAEIGSWYEQIDQTLLLSNEYESHLVVDAVGKAIGWSSLEQAREMCYTSRDIAAQGAALKAMKWVGYYNAQEENERV